jgi:peptidoglycan/xylan/chitin deacetylase (PgdA/CDA1 family)
MTPGATVSAQDRSGLSLMFEGGGQPISGAGGVIPDPIQKGTPDLPTNAFFAYGHYEGIPRVLDLMDKHGIKLSSFMIGKAVETSPDLAREIVRRGHEAAAHGRVRDNSYQLPRVRKSLLTKTNNASRNTTSSSHGLCIAS